MSPQAAVLGRLSGTALPDGRPSGLPLRSGKKEPPTVATAKKNTAITAADALAAAEELVALREVRLGLCADGT